MNFSQTYSGKIIERIDHLLSMSQRWLRIGEACKYGKLSRTTLMECVNNGFIKGKYRKKGGWIIDRLSIDEYNGAGIEDDLFNDVAERFGL